MSKAGENNGLIRPPADSVPDLNNREITPISSPGGVGDCRKESNRKKSNGKKSNRKKCNRKKSNSGEVGKKGTGKKGTGKKVTEKSNSGEVEKITGKKICFFFSHLPTVTFFPVTFFPTCPLFLFPCYFFPTATLIESTELTYFPNTCILTCPLLLSFLLLFFLHAHCFFFSCHFIHTDTQMNCYFLSCYFFSYLSTVTFFPVTFFPVTFFPTWNCYFLSCYLFSCYFLAVHRGGHGWGCNSNFWLPPLGSELFGVIGLTPCSAYAPRIAIYCDTIIKICIVIQKNWSRYVALLYYILLLYWGRC